MKLSVTRALLTSVLLITSASSYADFEFKGNATLKHPQGSETTIPFGFSFLKTTEGHVFSLGQHQMAVDEVPKRFSLALVLNDQNQVWVTDFHNKPLVGFDWQLASHSIQLIQQADLVPKRPGNFTLLLNGTRYHFTEKKRGMIHFHFTEKGIKEITVEAMIMPKR